MRVLLLGGTGLISTAIVQQLLDRGDEVTALNRGVTPVRVQGKLEIVRECGTGIAIEIKRPAETGGGNDRCRHGD